MKSLLLTAICCTIFAAGLAMAEEHHHDGAPTTTPNGPTTKASNKMCPVETEHGIDDREWVVYKGKTIGFCCEDCKAAFKKDPDKYIANAK